MLVAAALVIAGGATAAVSSPPAPRLRSRSGWSRELDRRARSEVGKPVGNVPIGFAPTNVTANGDQIWVLSWPARTAIAIDPERLQVVQTVGIDGDPDTQYSLKGKEWVGIPGGVRRIDNDGARRPALASCTVPTDNLNPNNGLFCTPSMTGAGQYV